MNDDELQQARAKLRREVAELTREAAGMSVEASMAILKALPKNNTAILDAYGQWDGMREIAIRYANRPDAIAAYDAATAQLLETLKQPKPNP